MAREHYEAYKRMLLKLHELDTQGKDQSPEANEIRDEMELPERHLTPLEQERLDGLSGDLYMLVGQEVKERSKQPVTVQDFLACYRARNWDRVLQLLGISNFHMEEHIVACTRAVCWGAFGDYDVALLFAEHAAKLKPDNPNYQTFVRLYRSKVCPTVNAVVTVEMSTFSPEQVLQESFNKMSVLQPA